MHSLGLSPRRILPLVLALLLVFAVSPTCSFAGSPYNPQVEDSAFYKRIMNILHTPAQPESRTQSDRQNTAIFGPPEAGKEQMVNYIRRNNPFPRLTCSLEELVELYYEEAGHEGIRPDLALSQAIVETGFFRYGRDVLPEQNNYCGLGSVGGGAKGAWFVSPRTGVRAHVQHLLAYASNREPRYPIVDPRFQLVRSLPQYAGQCDTWESLSGKWAIPGAGYGQRIVKIVETVKTGR